VVNRLDGACFGVFDHGVVGDDYRVLGFGCSGHQRGEPGAPGACGLTGRRRGAPTPTWGPRRWHRSPAHRLVAVATTEVTRRRWVEAGHHRQERVVLNDSVEAEEGGSAPEPATRRLPTIQVVRRDRISVYEQVLAEGTEDDVRWFIDVGQLVDLWDELVLSPHVRTT
jgi:hypothetical protein